MIAARAASAALFCSLLAPSSLQAARTSSRPMRKDVFDSTVLYRLVPSTSRRISRGMPVSICQAGALELDVQTLPLAPKSMVPVFFLHRSWAVIPGCTCAYDRSLSPAGYALPPIPVRPGPDRPDTGTCSTDVLSTTGSRSSLDSSREGFSTMASSVSDLRCSRTSATMSS